MINIRGYIDNEREVMRQLRNLEDGVLKDRVHEALVKGAESVAVEAMRRVPIRTGALLRSIKTRSSKKNLTAIVYADYPDSGAVRRSRTRHQRAGSRVYYAVAIEYGTKHIAAHPFLNPALEVKAPEILGSIDEAMEGALNATVGAV
jgi:HK97 gp10 family phage protein